MMRLYEIIVKHFQISNFDVFALKTVKKRSPIPSQPVTDRKGVMLNSIILDM